jgi:hypothetical protein
MPGRLFQGLLIATLAIFVAASSPVHAAGAGEKQVAAALGGALTGGGDLNPGMQAGVEAALGLTDTWAGRAAVSGSWQPSPGSDGPRHVTALTLGGTYSLDVLRWVPFLDLGFSLADLRGNGASSQRLGPQVGLGVEYLLSRRWTLAALARFDYFALRLAGPASGQPWWASAAIRVGRVF